MAARKREQSGVGRDPTPIGKQKPERSSSLAPATSQRKTSSHVSKTTETRTVAQAVAIEEPIKTDILVVPKPNTSTANPMTNNASTPSEVNANDKFSKLNISLYALRHFINSEKVKLRAVFGSGLEQDFKEVARLANSKQSAYIPSVFQLSINIRIDADNIPHIVTEKTQHSCTKYKLRVEKLNFLFSNLKCDQKEERSIMNGSSSVQFLFDSQFDRDINRIELGTNVTIWDQLCFFTYFVIQSNQLDLLPTLMNQFAICVHSNEFVMSSNNFLSFTETTYKHLSYINDNLDRPTSIQAILQMWGVLPVKIKNLSLVEPIIHRSIMAILKHVFPNIENVFIDINKTEWSVIKDGLVLLIYIETLSFNKNSECDSIQMLIESRMNMKNKEEVVYTLFKKFLESQERIHQSNWIDLLNFMPKDRVTCDYLKLSSSFDTFFRCSQHILQCSPNDDNVQNHIRNIFDEMINNQILNVQLNEIIMLLKFVQDPLPDDENLAKSKQAINSIVETSVALQYKIKSYLSKLILKDTDVILLYELFQYYNPILIFNIDKQTYLQKILSQNERRSWNFYFNWFKYFLCDENYVDTTQESYYFEILMNKWLDKVTEDFSIFRQIMAEMDTLLDRLSHVDCNKVNKRRLNYFIKHMIDKNFKRGSISDAIINVGSNIRNATFIEEFKRRFKEDFFLPNRNKVKMMQTLDNPLMVLVELSKRKELVHLTRHLLEICCNTIEISQDELLQHTLERPSNYNLTYFILFENCFKEMHLHQHILDQLDKFWNLWEHDGLQARQIKCWQNFTSNEKYYFNQIWNFVGLNTKKTYQVNKLFDSQYQEMLRIIKLKENIVNCLNTYCLESTDIEKYFGFLHYLQQRIDDGAMKGIQIQAEIKTLEPIVFRLSQVSKSNAWLHYYTKHLGGQQILQNDKDIHDADNEENFNIDSLFHEEQEENGNVVEKKGLRKKNAKQYQKQINDEQTTIITEDATVKPSIAIKASCNETLTNANSLFNRFIGELDKFCTNYKDLSIERLLIIFPDVGSIESDMKILKEFIHADVIPYLRSIFAFWKDRKHLHNVSFGFKNLFERYNFTANTGLQKTLDDLVGINKQTIANDCYNRYKDYLETVENIYSKNLIDLCAALHTSKQLINLLDDLTMTDADNLLEAVNDWDETLISTKSVIDFVKLKTFFIRIHTSIEQRRSYKYEILFEEITQCLDKIFKDDEFKNIIELFDTCSQSVAGIKHLYLELTNKEQSKRRCILDIMTHSSLFFIENLDSERLFDVQIKPQNLTFDDLSELRDRARLIEYSNAQKRNQDHNPETQKLELFVELVRVIESVIKNLSSLYIAGFPAVIQIVNNPYVTCKQGKYNELQHFHNFLIKKLKRWEEQLRRMYEIYPELTYFSHEQFQMVEDFIYNIGIEENHPGYNLLKYIGFEPTLLQQVQLPPKLNDEYERLEILGRILATQRSTVDDLEEMEEAFMYQSIRLVETTDDGILRAAFSLFDMTGKSIHAHQLFYCTKRTTWVEIRAFIYRCFFSKKYQVLIRPDLLSLIIQDSVLPLLDNLIKHHPTHVLGLGIITTKAASHIQLINAIKTRMNVDILNDQKLLNKEDLTSKIQNMLHQCTIVTSRLSGLGKSQFIKKESHRLNMPLIKLPIGGEVKSDDIADRIRVLHKKSLGTFILHLDIGHVENINDLDELLYCLILFRCFCFGQSAGYISAETLVYIELASSPFIKTNEHVIICQYFIPIHINELNWDELDCNNAMVQFVGKYLNAIDTGTIVKQDIKLDDNSVIDATVCLALIQNRFLQRKNLEFITWTQISIFIAVYYSLFNRFSTCGYFLTEVLNENEAQLRLDILQALLRSSDQFTSISVEKVRMQQRASLKDEADVQQAILSDTIVRWENTQPFTLVFTATHDPLFVYKTSLDMPESLRNHFNNFEQAVAQRSNRKSTTAANTLLNQTVSNMIFDYNKLSHVELFHKLASLSSKYLNKAICTACFKQYPHETQRCTYCNTHESILRPATFDNDDVLVFQTNIATIIEAEYVLTPDNYVKMLLIYMRIQSQLPVLIMGETGCGKTALIKFLCQKVLDDELEIFRIHAGITSEKIIQAMRQLIHKATQLAKEEKHLWIFFDEFNTTSSIELLKEITCERTLLGDLLPNNMIFLGACNPRRYKSNENWLSFKNNIGIKKDRYEMMKNLSGGRSLLYTVVPIPETMLEYIWDYGYLDQNTERAYIQTMLKTCPSLVIHEQLLNTIIKFLSESQQFIRKIEDVSSVSLRDIARFCRLYNWFHQSIIMRSIKQALPSCNVSRRAAFAAIFLCYYFRLPSIQLKYDYVDMLEKILLESFSLVLMEKRFLIKQLESEEHELIEMMELPKGTAKNRALCENLFLLFVCIVNRIPVVLCGKPGCSKTSAVQILISNLNGKRSKNIYFQTLPELITVSYQGSQNCTSSSIEKVFERAGKYHKAQLESQLLPVIVFDEIGLAELSPHNPLKVLHAELEVESCRYGFVGISNWRLDASKMNRVLYISCPDPDIDDLKTTAKSIADGMLGEQPRIPNLDSILNSLAKAYHELFTYLTTQQENEYYFGLRDFYSLVKGFLSEAISTIDGTGEDLYAIIYRQMKINFDGIVDGSDFMWKIFCDSLNHSELVKQYPLPSFRDLLTRRISTNSGRFLMLIGKSESSYDYVERYLRSIRRYLPVHDNSIRTLIGSQMPGDLILNRTYTETYSYRVLMDIILHVETNVTLLMRQLGHLHDNLYDLFNQSFAVSAKKQYCRIALGALYHPRCLVNDNFSCIVFVNQDEVEKCDPPFLNRFEKHMVDIQDLVQPIHWRITDVLLEWLRNLLPSDDYAQFPSLKHIFIGFNHDYLCNLVIDTCEEKDSGESENIDQQAVIELCKMKLLRCSSFDLPLVLVTQNSDDKQKRRLIRKYYECHERKSFADVLQRHRSKQLHPISNSSPFVALLSSVAKKQIIYTYTQIHDTINYDDKKTSQEIKLNSMLTELEVLNRIKEHLMEQSGPRILIIRLDYQTEHRQLLSLKYILLNAIDDESKEPSDKRIWLVIHLQRNRFGEIKNDVLFHGWQVDMIDDLNAYNPISIETLKNSSYYDLIDKERFKLTENLFNELANKTLSKLRYQVATHELEPRINKRRNIILDYLLKDNRSELRILIQDSLFTLIKTIRHDRADQRFSDWRKDLLTNGLIIATCRSLNDALNATISQFYETYFLLLFAHLERYNFFDSHLFIETSQNKNEQQLLQEIWNICLKMSLKNIEQNVMNLDNVEIPLVFDLRLPFSMMEYTVVKGIYKTVSQQQLENDANIGDVEQRLWEKLNNKTMYEKNIIGNIFETEKLFQHYFHDLLCSFLNENNIKLTINFVVELTSSNSTRSIKTRFQTLLMNWEETIQILRIFELGKSLIGEAAILKVCKRQFIKTDDLARIDIDKKNDFYSLILCKENFYLVDPGSNEKKLKNNSNDNNDLFIEISLMNLLKKLQKPKYVRDVESPKQLTATYNLIYHGIRTLTNYIVDNLERFSSHICLIRSITSLFDNHIASKIIKQIYGKDDVVNFNSCAAVHTIIGRLRSIIETSSDHLQADQATVQRTLLKLEIELLKNWLIDHGDQYCDVLVLINAHDNDLWRYSSKIFLYINRRLDLMENIEQYNGQIQIESDDFQYLKKFLKKSSDQSFKVQILLVNHLHTNLILSISENDFENILTKNYEFFERNMYEVNNLLKKRRNHIHLLSLIVWLKSYTQIYAFVLYNDSHQEVMSHIDRFLAREESPFGSTIKLFILKQLVHMSKNVTLSNIRELFSHRNFVWLRPLITRTEPLAINRDLVLPLPLFEGHDDYLELNEILNNFGNIDEVQTLIKKCQTNQQLTYGLFLWFIQYYCRYLLPNIQIDEKFIQIFCVNLKQLLIDSFELIGFNLLVFLCSNFPNESYFYIHPNMSKKELHCRLVGLNIVALCLSTKCSPKTTYIGTLLFDKDQHMPQNYVNHINSICLLGMISSDPVITQMIDVRTQIQDRLNKNLINDGGKFVFQCSRDCHWMFYFEDCGVPNDRRQCPLCKMDIGASRYNQLIQRNPPQIQMRLEDGFREIEQYMQNYNSILRLGYYNVTSAIELTTGEKPDHLNRTVSFRFLHMWTHAQLLMLHELKYLTDEDLLQRLKVSNILHFRQHFDRDCSFMEEISTEPEQYHIWLFKLINHMLEKTIDTVGILNTNEQVVKIEQSIEQRIIFPHVNSIINEIGQYRRAYADFVQKFDEEISLANYVDELRQNDTRYPLLQFFNVNRILTAKPLDEFRIKMQTIPYGEKMYPLTTFLLKRLNEYANIRYLYPIMEFSKYLINKYNHRIQRNDAATITIAEAIRKEGFDSQTMRILCNNFIDAWYNINLSTVRLGCQERKFIRPYPREEFMNTTSLACVLPNKSKDDSSFLLLACIHTLAELQNEIVGYFRKAVVTEIVPMTRVFLNAIRPEHLLQLGESEIINKLLKDSFVINYEYGHGRDIIYDYEEIEIEMHNYASNLCLFDTENIPTLSYQFELYNENSSLITNIRRRIPQTSLTAVDQAKFKSLLVRMDHHVIINCLGFLDNVFTYLCNIDDDLSKISIQHFMAEHMNMSACLNEDIFRSPPFSKILLIHIISLYELIEEIAFDIALRKHVKLELREAVLDDQNKAKFVAQTFRKNDISPKLKSPMIWIGLLKRLLIRVLNAYIDLKMPLQLYIERIDLWSGDISEMDLQTFEIDDNILLEHTYCILNHVETYQPNKHINEPMMNETQQNLKWNITTDNNTEILNVRTWYADMNQPIKKLILDKSNGRSNKKLRV